MVNLNTKQSGDIVLGI